MAPRGEPQLFATQLQITTDPESLSSVREALESAGIAYESVETTMVPKTTVELDDEAAAKKTRVDRNRERRRRSHSFPRTSNRP